MPTFSYQIVTCLQCALPVNKGLQNGVAQQKFVSAP
jgi:hypothetical protein